MEIKDYKDMKNLQKVMAISLFSLFLEPCLPSAKPYYTNMVYPRPGTYGTQ